MSQPPPPDARDLLLPLLACLPTAFVSPRPPPALLPLLSPLLRQRLTYLNGASSSDGGWLPLLSWDAAQGPSLPGLVENMHLEPHPVSGEVELDDVRAVKYRRLDKETLQAKLEVEQFELAPVYLWCENDEHGGTGPGWKLAELKSLETTALDDGMEWVESIAQADEVSAMRLEAERTPLQSNAAPHPLRGAQLEKPDDNDDDDYWAAYDRTPGRTPAQKRSPAPPTPANNSSSTHHRTPSELEYYARYSAEVQPALDSHDPDEDPGATETAQSTLNGTAHLSSPPNGRSLYPGPGPPHQPQIPPQHPDLSAPIPISPTSSLSSSVSALESHAVAHDRARLAVSQHISTDIKSLFRLARSSGMDRREFERVVRRELEVLSLFEEGEEGDGEVG